MPTMQVVAYRGWAAGGKAVVLGRVIEEPRGLPRRLRDASRLVRVTLERFATRGVPRAVASVSLGSETRDATADEGGFLDVSLAAGPGPARIQRGDRAALGDIHFTSDGARLGVVSDIDDTVLETELTHPWRRAMQLVYSEQRMRPAFDGIVALYRAFAEPGNPIFYVSNAPWTLYDHVVELLDHHDMVKGPLLLRDRGLERRAGEPHKRTALRRLLDDHPGLTFVLLGDSTRQDPLRYVEVAESHPGRVAAIYIRRLRGLLAGRADPTALAARARAAKAELVIAGDTVTMARHAASLGLVAPSEVGEVREAKREDELSQ
jgi:phosphatidate phosphatase APP1